MGLPGAIEAIENPFTLPQSLLEKMKIVQSEGGLKFLEEQIKVLDKMAQQTAAMLTEALKILDQEEKDDNEMRAKYKEKWTRYFPFLKFQIWGSFRFLMLSLFYSLLYQHHKLQKCCPF
jgi:hypothetical protein